VDHNSKGYRQLALCAVYCIGLHVPQNSLRIINFYTARDGMA